MANPNDNLRRLYQNGLKHFSLPDFDTFQQDMKDEQKRRRFYNNMQVAYSLPDFDTFSTDIGAVTVATPTPAPTQAPTQPQQTPATVQPVTDNTAEQATVKPTVETATQPQQPEGWKPSAMQQQAFQMQMDAANARLEKQGEEFQQRMEGIRKGNKSGAFMGEREFNPQSGRMERTYYTTQGDRVAGQTLQSRANSEYHQWWENNTEAGRESRDKRLQREFEERLEGLWNRQKSADVVNAAEQAWSAAESRQKTARERNAKRNWDSYADMGVAAGREMRVVTTSSNRHEDMVDRLTNFDLDRLMNDSWDNLGDDGQKALIDDCYKMLRYRNPGVDELVVYNQAKDFARQQSDLRLYHLAVEKNRPKNELDYLMRKIGDMNMLSNITKGLDVSAAKSTGDMAAYEAANEQYRQDGHKILDVTGTVAGFALDPTTWLSAGVGGAATRGAMWAGGRYLAGRGASAAVTRATARQFANTLTGRIVGGVVGGSVNFGTFEGVKEMENQFVHGGHIVGQDDSGRYINEGYSALSVGGQTLHGLGMGAAIGWLGPVTGNVSDKLVRGTSSTLGKVATRSGLYAGATVAEGTIFSVPEWIEGNRDGFDVWTDNMAMMAGFKAKHMLKSAGAVLGDLKASFDIPTDGTRNRLDFESRLRQRMDAPSDGGLALTKDEQYELKRYGYDLRELVESAEHTGNAEEGGIIAQNAPKIVSRLTDMVKDPRVSEAARAKMYYYATGRMLPMSPVMRGEMYEDDNGGIIVESQGANGVITSRSFKTRKAADLELQRINRQAELNSIEFGERYQRMEDFESRLQDACRSVAEENGWDVVEVYRICEDARRNRVRGVDKELDEVQQNILRKVTDAMGDFENTDITYVMRSEIGDKYGVYVDWAIRKDGDRRTEAEQKAVEEYIGKLIPKKAKDNPIEDVEAEEFEPKEITDKKFLGAEVDGGEFPDLPEDPIDPRFDSPMGGGPRQPAEGEPIGRAVMKYQDREVEVLSGRVVMTDDGAMVDKELSDRSIVIRDVATGKVEMVAPEAILTYEGYSEAAAEMPTEATPHGATPQGAVPEADATSQPKYGIGAIKIRNSDGTETRGFLTGEVDENGNHEYYVEGDRQHFHYASEHELDNILSEYIPDKPQQTQEAQQTAPKPVDPNRPKPEGVANVEAYDEGYSLAMKNVQEFSDEKLTSAINELRNGAETLTDFGRGLLEGYEYEQQRRAQSVPETPENVLDPTENAVSDAEIAPETVSSVENGQQTALSRIPRDAKGEPIFEQAENPEHGWDALVEFSEGDVATAKEIADTMAEEKRKAYEKAKKLKPKGKTPTEILESKRNITAELAKAEQEYNLWQQMASVEQRRQDAIRAQQEAETRRHAAERAEAEKAEREAREEAARQEREALEGIPEWHLDTPENARKRGARRFSGQMYRRQEPVQGVVGNEMEVKFSQQDLPKGRVAVIEASQLQPSHVQGERNPMYFIDEAQPKDRSEAVSVDASRRIAEGIRPEEITGSSTAYTGAPTVNSRGEVIQGNNRSDALRYLWEHKMPEQQRAYKEYLLENAERLGLDRAAIEGMDRPVLVNMLDVDDAEAIRLGQMTAQDTESGGIERIKPKNVAQKLGENMRTFANLLLKSGNDDASFGQLVDRNGADVLRWMNESGAISDTQYQSAFDSKGNLTAEAKNDLQKVLYQAVFKGGSQQLEEMFGELPVKAQRAILSTAFRDMDSPESGRMLSEIQSSIVAYNVLMKDPAFSGAKNMEQVMRAISEFRMALALDDRLESYRPSDNFSNFALHLAGLYKAGDMSQSTIAGYFNEMYDLAQGRKEANLFEEADGTRYALAEVIKKVLNIDYEPAKNGNRNDRNGGADVALRDQAGAEGESGGSEPPAGRERVASGAGAPERGGGIAGDSTAGGAAVQNNIPEKKEVTSADPRAMPDDEKARRGDMLRNAPAIEVAVGQIVATKELSARRAAEQWWDENVAEPAFYDTEVGEVEINKNSVESSLAHKYGQMKLDAITSLIEGFENAVYLGTMPDFTRQEGVSNHFFAYPINYNGKRCYVFCRAMQDANKNRLYVHEVFVSDKIKKGDTLQTAASQPHGGIALYRDILANVLLSPNSSEWHLAEHPTDVPDLLPTQGKSEISDRKVTNSTSDKQEDGGESSVQPSDNKGVVGASSKSLEFVNSLFDERGRSYDYGATLSKLGLSGEQKLKLRAIACMRADGWQFDATGRSSTIGINSENFELTRDEMREIAKLYAKYRAGMITRLEWHKAHAALGKRVASRLADEILNNKSQSDLPKNDRTAAVTSEVQGSAAKPAGVRETANAKNGASSGRWYGTESEMPATPGLADRRRRALFEGSVEAFSRGTQERARHGLSHSFGEDAESGELSFADFAARYREEVTDATYRATEEYLPAVFDHLRMRMERALAERRGERGGASSPADKPAAPGGTSEGTDESVGKVVTSVGTRSGRRYDVVVASDVTRDGVRRVRFETRLEDGRRVGGYVESLQLPISYIKEGNRAFDIAEGLGQVVGVVVDSSGEVKAELRGGRLVAVNDLPCELAEKLGIEPSGEHRGERLTEAEVVDYEAHVGSQLEAYVNTGTRKRDIIRKLRKEIGWHEEVYVAAGYGREEARSRAEKLVEGLIEGLDPVRAGDFDVYVENSRGSVRRGVDSEGNIWETEMKNDYGFISGTKSKDGDNIDVFLHEDLDSWDGRKVYVVDQTNTDGTFDEHKVMLGFNDKDEAMSAYLANYDKTWAEKHPGLRISEVSVEEFGDWIDSSKRKTKPFADYSSVSKITNDNPTESTTAISGKGYKVEPKPYTNKQGKTLDTYLVTFDRDFSKEELSALRAKAKALKGWYDRESKGWMLRSVDDAKAFAEGVAGKSEDEIADEAPLSMSDMQKPTDAPVKKVDVGSVANTLKTKGETKLSDHAEPVEPAKQKKRRWISDEDADEFNNLRNDLRNYFGKGDDIVQEGTEGYGKPQPKQMDAEVLRMGTRMTYLMMKGGLRSFSDYCEAMKDELPDIFDEMRPHLKSLYAAAQNMEEVIQLGWDEEMDDRKTVKAFDVYNFDKQGAKDIIATAQHTVDERASQQQTDNIIQTLKDQRNEQRKKEADETSADTEAVVNKAEASADEIESNLETATTEEDAERLSADIDKELEEVNKQLALLGYYEADPVDKDFNEAYGYMRNAERKATQDAHNLARQLAADLGLTINPKDKVKKSKYGFGSKIARSNVAPAGGEVYITLPLAENRELSIWLSLEKNEPWLEGGREDRSDEDLVLTGIMYRVENPNGGERYVTNNQYISPTSTYDELLGAIRRLARDYLPADVVKPATALAPQPGEDYVAMAKRVAAGRSEQKPAVESDKPMEDLFAGKQSSNTLTAYDELKAKHPDTVVLMKVGDFYTTYRDDATTISNVLGITLTRRPNGKDGKVELAGFPAGLLDQYLPKLIRAGHRVALGDYQTKSPVVKRQKPTESTSDKPAEATATAADMPRGGKGSKPGKRATKSEQSAEDALGGLFDMEERGESPYIVTPETEAELAKQREAETNTSKPNQNERTDLQPRPEEAGRRGQQPRPDEQVGARAGNEDERTDRRGVAQRGGEHTVSDTKRGAGVSGQHQSERSVGARRTPSTPATPRNTRNNHAERGVDYAPKGEKARIDANLAAIKLAKELLATGATATPEQMAVLRKYSGWGGLGSAFNEGEAWRPNPVNKQLREILSPEEYEAAVMSRNSAYYTPAPIIDAMWDIAQALGFKGGNIVEGSAGIGNIIGLMPREISERSDIHAVEIDNTTGGILSLLYPDAKVEIQGFEATRIANGSVDLAITNVPFVTGLHVMDESGDGDLSKKFRDIHDFCIAKNVRKLREGGIGIFITSSGTLDKSQKLRNWLVGDKEGNADVVGVFRMNNQTFGGTAATSDIIVVRKRVNGRKSANAIDVSTVTPARTASFTDVKGKTKDLPLYVNRYFIEHPEHMGGEMFFGFEQGDTYRPTSIGLFPTRTADQPARLAAWVQHLAEMDWSKEQGGALATQVSQINEKLGDGVKEGSMIVDSEGNLCVARMGHAVPLALNKNKIKGRTKEQCFSDYTEIKDALNEVLKYQTEHDDDAGLQPLLDRLNHAYDTFVQRYGNLNKNKNLAWLRNDVDFSSIVALETYSEKANKDGSKVKTYGKTDIFSRRVVEKESEPSPKNVKDGIIASLYKFGRIDPEYLSEQLGKSREDVKREIIESGLGFEDPMTGQMEVSYEYLSGNVREKLRQAREANETSGGGYEANIKALEAVVPMNIPAHLIEFSLGSSWIEPQLYEKFIKERTDLDIKLTNAGGTWHMKEPWNTDTPKNKEMGIRSEMFGTLIPGHKLIEAAITNKQITVSRRVKTGNTETTETDPAATAACGAKVDEIRQDFKDWAREQMQADPALSMRMEEKYNEKFNNSVPKSIPDEFVPEHFGGAATTVGGKPFRLRTHQAKAVIRATTQPVLLAHEVGTGKTYTLITTAMEMRRLGTARKPMIVVQNATVGQFVASAKALYPNAKVLTLEDADRNAEGRRAFYAKIKFNDWDMIVVPQSVFERIPDSVERQTQFIQDKIEEKMLVLEQMKDADPSGRSQIVRAAEREIARWEDELTQLANGEPTDKKKEKDAKKAAISRQNAEVKARELLDRATDDVEDFDSMGIDAILVDEAHEYKHLGFATAMQRGVKGVDPSPSKKSQGVFLKAQAVLEKTGGKNVVFATGTPISNTAAEIWTFMRYLMPADVMKDYGIYYFDDFVRNFGNLQQMLEFKTNGKYDEVNRFAGYVNLPELVRIWSTVADTVLTREAGGVSDKIPQMEGDKAQDIFLPQTRALRSIMKYVKEQLEAYDKMSGKEKKENSHIPLVMYGIAKAAAVDGRLVQSDAVDDPNSKTNEAVRQTLRTLDETKDYKGTVAIFADNYQNKASGFNLYEDIRKKLIAAGVPEEQVVVMKSGMTVNKKLEIFNRVNAGEVRVVLGSTFTLGTGVNIQERLHTLIHLDAPNRPMDYTQRNGRILRQGNMHNEWGIPVRLLRFGVEDSLDVTAYQRLKTKGAIADSIMNGKQLMENSMENRSLEEDQDLFGDITAQLSGSEYAMLKNQIEKEVRKLTAKYKAWKADQTYIHNRKRQIAGQNKEAEKRIADNKSYLEKVEAATIGDITVGKLSFPSIEAMEEFFTEQNKKKAELQEQVRTSGYSNRPATSDLTITVGGFDFNIHTEISRETKQGQQGDLFYSAPAKMTYSCPELGIEAMPVKGNVVKNAVLEIMGDVVSGNDFRESIEALERSLERNNAELRSMASRDGVPFQHTEELARAEAKLEEYEELMKKEMEAKEAKYAEMDKDVEAARNVELTEEDSEDATSEPEAEYSAENANFASGYETADGKTINYTSENAEGYGGLFDFDFSGEDRGGEAVDNRAGADKVQRQGDSRLTERNSGLNEADGEFSVVERVFTESGSFNFTSGEKIESADDVAFIFSALEDAAKEHSFVVLVKDGKPTVVELGMGTFTATMVDIPTASLAYNRIRPDQVYFVHNHPSGNLICSPQDVQMLRKIGEMSDVPVMGVIINLKTGKYGTFDTNSKSGTGEKRVPANENALTVHTLDKQIFAPNYDPMEQPLVRDSKDVAEFLNSQRMGDRAKVSFLILSRANRIVGNIHTPFTEIPANVDDMARYISERVIQFGGESAILYGDFKTATAKGLAYRKLKERMMQVGSTTLLDVVHVKGNHTTSANDEGLLYEPGSEYGAGPAGDLRFREVDDESVLKEFAEGKVVKAYRTMQIIDGKLYSPMATKVGGKETPEIKLGVPEQAEEHPEIIKGTKIGKDGVEVGYVVIDKGLGKGSLVVAYNPSIHASRTVANDQFTSADIRPNLVVVETLIPESELTSGYRAPYAKNAVGEMSWHSGTVSGRLARAGKPRRVILSRYDMPVRILTFREVAEKYAKLLEGTDIEIPYNTIQPQVRSELERLGVPISEEAAGRVGEDGDFGKAEYITDREIERINARHQEMAQTSTEARIKHAERMSKQFNTPIRVVADPKELTSDNGELQARMRRSKGFYDPATGEVVVVVANNATVEDVAETVFHEVVGHKGLREMIGEGNYDDFCDEVYEHLKDELKEQVDEETTRRFINEPGKGYEHHRRVAVDEMFGRMAEKGFEDFTKAERGIWAKLKTKVLEAINKFLGSLKLPKWVKLGDNELRYMLWRSHERLREKGDYVDMARDVAKREELGLRRTEALRERKNETTADKIEKSFDAAISGNLKGKPVEVGKLTQEGRAFLEKLSGIKMKENVSFVLNPSDLVHIYRRHYGVNEKDGRNIPLTKEDIRQMSEIVSTPDRIVYGKEISGNQRNMFFFLKEAQDGSYNLMEIYSDKKGNLTAKSFFKSKEGVSQRVMLLNESSTLTSVTDGATLLDDAKLPKFFENPTISEEESFEYRFRDGETEDIWKDQSVGLEERITNAAIRLSANQSGDLTLRNDAMRAIGDNLTSLRKAMAAQRRFDQVTVKRVADLARILMQNGYLSGMTSGEMQRLISAVKNSVGHKEIKESVEKVMDIMVGNQLRNGEATLRQLLAIRGSKVDARGVEVQGQLDVEGQRTMEVVKKAMTLTEDDITSRIAEATNRMSDPDNTISDQAALEYAALHMAFDYVKNIANSKAEEKTLRDELKRAKEDKDAGRMTDDAYKQYVETTEDAIRKNKIERAEAYFNLVGRLSDSLRGSIENAKAFREAEKVRVNEIHHNANSDMEGRPSNEHHKDDWKDKFMNNGFVQFLFAPLGTFDQILRVMGNKSANGEGYLWSRFMRGWVDCRNKELQGVRAKFAQLDEKAAELFGKGKTWSKLIRMAARMPKATVSFWDGGEMRDHELTQGNLLYIYMVDKMTDGRMKLRRMGITEQDVSDIERVLDPRFKALGDWLQDEFLVATRNEYNETHKRMFGASMAAIENYFPLKILANARIDKEEDVNQQNQPEGITTKTGSIIKRRVNNLALDITGADALSVILDHITQMEHWSAYAEWNRDLNTLRTYKRFRNQVINMTTVYGGGRKLWENFNDLFLMAAGEYRPPIAKLDKSAVNLAKGVTAAKVSFRMYTALKQLLSAPAYIPEISVRAIAKSIANPYGDFKWCLENLPIFRERWHSRISGDPRLLKSDMDWKMWRSRIMEISSRIGMTPNAFVDAVTVSIGARAMYETRLNQYLKEGYPADAAEKRAKQDAAILFNQTQQSSESPFLSTMQVDRSWLSVLYTVFRNSAMSYTRQEFDAMRNLKRNLTRGQRAKSVEFMTQQILRDWDIDPDHATDDEYRKANDAARNRFRRQIKKDIMRIATFGFIIGALWNLGPYLPYIFFGNEDDEKDKMWDDALTHAYFGSVEGLTGGDVMSSFGNMVASGEWSWNQLSKDMPLASDINTIANKFIGGKNAEAVNDILNLLVQSGIGMNPQSLTDAAIAITDACGDDPALSHEAAIFVMRVLQVPQSQLDKLYFDEIGLSGEEASKLTPEQLAGRYAEYKVKRGTALAPWTWGDEERLGKYEDLAKERMKERLDSRGDASVLEAYADFEARYKAVEEEAEKARAFMKTDYAAAAQAHAALQQNPDFGLYQRFGSLDKQLSRICKMWLTAKTPEEAALIAATIPAYRAGMVKVLQADSAEAEQSAMAELTTLMNDFYGKYQSLHPQPMQLP